MSRRAKSILLQHALVGLRMNLEPVNLVIRGSDPEHLAMLAIGVEHLLIEVILRDPDDTVAWGAFSSRLV
jgi:hypothetical protein